MNNRKAIKKVAKHVPVANSYLNYRNLKTESEAQKAEIIGLNQVVKRLEARNEEWAAEVRSLRGEARSLSIVWPVKEEDLINADWTKPNEPLANNPKQPPYTFTWVVPPMGPVSGGHADIFRTINYLESKGHTCNVYFYDALNTTDLNSIQDNLKNYSPLKAKMFYNDKTIPECDAIFATNWFTAYPVYNYKGSAKKYYFVQDFEPYFEPVGTYSTLAENTYKFGLRGITLGSWLTDKLSQEFGMKCDYFELGVNSKEYYLINHETRKKVFFYARPVTPRRGFELGILALDIFHRDHPEYEINFVGWDVSPYQIPFPYKNLGILSPDNLNRLYNESAAGLVLSFTNMSLLPLEMLSSGCRPVINDAVHTRTVSYANELVFSPTSPKALANNLYKAIQNMDKPKITEIANFAKKFEWNDSNKKIENILIKDLT